jgi:hypothetical protein
VAKRLAEKRIAPPFEVVGSRAQQLRVVADVAQKEVASPAQEATHDARRVAVVDVEGDFTPTDSATTFLLLQ